MHNSLPLTINFNDNFVRSNFLSNNKFVKNLAVFKISSNSCSCFWSLAVKLATIYKLATFDNYQSYIHCTVRTNEH